MRIGVGRRTVLAAGLAAAGAVGLAASPAQAAPATVTAGCVARITQVQALDLQEPPKDEVYLLFGDTRFPSGGTVDFTVFTVAAGSQFGNPTKFIPGGGSVRLSGMEADFPSGDDSLGSLDFTCANNPPSPRDMTGPQSVYRVWFTLTPF